jgi:hypothetical protein
MEESSKKPDVAKPFGKFKPGQSGNPLGKPAGAVNHTTTEVRRILTNVVADHLPQVYADLAALSPKDRVAAIIAISQIVMPRLSAVAIGNAEGQGIEKKQIFLYGGKELEF